MKKKIWLTSLEGAQDAVQHIMASLKKYGLEIDGHFWEDDLEKMAWCKPRGELVDENVKMWIIYGSAESLVKKSVRYGLSMLALTTQAQKGIAFPIVVVQAGTPPVTADTLPERFSNCVVYQGEPSGYGAKIVAALHKPVAKVTLPYRIDVYGIPQIGQWFEVGPVGKDWQGVIFATEGETIKMHAVGNSGQLPEKSVLNYAQQGLKIDMGEVSFDGWAVQNVLDADTSYFVKVEGAPKAVMFCPYSQEDEAEAYVIRLS
ncbi:hypothetical protein [Desulfopila sp. IMCC35008]|uniref:hypothetical protein n=1 Tax=Desulfopila sp. IMCC35008 TaxID=2653858 RepID=UPI0013D85445|nr:hypothetical protein [Desulfopila sp. IMCC35008]